MTVKNLPELSAGVQVVCLGRPAESFLFSLLEDTYAKLWHHLLFNSYSEKCNSKTLQCVLRRMQTRCIESKAFAATFD